MKITPATVCVLASGLVLGCTPTGEILEEFGRIHSPGGNWTVELSSGDPGLRIIDRRASDHPGARQMRRLTGARTKFSTGPSEWTNHPGAFVFIDEEDRIWAWNGRDSTFIHERFNEFDSISTPGSIWPDSIPDEVKARLIEDETVEQ